MRRCLQCNAENADSMNFCLQCGAALPPPVNNSADNPPPTQFYGSGSRTNPNTNPPTQFAPGAPNYNNAAPPPQKKSNAKIFLAIGGVLALLVLLGIVGIGIVAYSLMSGSRSVANNYPTPTPRTLGNTMPTPLPSAYPSTAPVNVPNGASGKFDRIWIDYNTQRGGRTGMLIHTKFSVYNMQGTECYLALYFQQADGTYLPSENQAFRSTNGRLALFQLLRPNYPNTDFNDIDLFLPYGEFNVTTGKYNLKVDADLITKEGTIIQHLGFHDFQYERLAGN